MAQVVYVLGAGFNCSVLDQAREIRAPLATNFFQVFFASSLHQDRMEGYRNYLPVNDLLGEIQHYWKLDQEGLASGSFDIEECITFFESQVTDAPSEALSLLAARCKFAVPHLLLAYLGSLGQWGDHTPAYRRFGDEVIGKHADVLTFNYDTIAEDTIKRASGEVNSLGDRWHPPMPLVWPPPEVPADYLNATAFHWNANLAHGIKFNKVAIPMPGASVYVGGSRYYSHPDNVLYDDRRVLKLHGSINWLKYTDQRSDRPIFSAAGRTPPNGIFFQPSESGWLGRPIEDDGWFMEPVIIPPQLYKEYDQEPYSAIWQTALQSLSECQTLIVAGYSFPPTDFRTRRLFLEAFSDHQPDTLVVVNPDRNVKEIARRLTHYSGNIDAYDDLATFYGVPEKD
jgi:SIR2-like domain